MFPEKEIIHKILTRNPEKSKVEHANTTRFRNSAIVDLQKLAKQKQIIEVNEEKPGYTAVSCELQLTLLPMGHSLSVRDGGGQNLPALLKPHLGVSD